MFERYNERARRAIFFARYEASAFGCDYIEPEHLLLGILREDQTLRDTLPKLSLEEIRNRIEAASPRKQKVSTSVDIPLSQPSKQVLAYAAEEAERMGHKHIDCGHHVIGLLRVGGLAADLLREQGATLAQYREIVQGFPSGDSPQSESPAGLPLEPSDLEFAEPAAASLRPIFESLRNLLEGALAKFEYSPRYGEQKLKRNNWTRKEGLGHLIDMATAHRLWLARALTEPKVTAAGYPTQEWVAVQQYQAVPWPYLVNFWATLNQLLLHVLTVFPEDRVNTPVRIGIEDPIPVHKVLERYVEHTKDVIGQLTALL